MNNQPQVLEPAPGAVKWNDVFHEERGPDIELKDIGKNVEKIKRFVAVAHRGGLGGSGGEQRSARLAKLMSEAIEECADIDLEVVEGAALLMCYAATGDNGYCFARDVLNNFLTQSKDHDC